MELAAAVSIPHALSLAWKALTFAWTQYANLQGYQEQCRLLIKKSQEMVLVISERNQLSRMTEQLKALERYVQQIVVNVGPEKRCGR